MEFSATHLNCECSQYFGI